jgi:hypothetical protein
MKGSKSVVDIASISSMLSAKGMLLHQMVPEYNPGRT